jgi:hypothetical protein
VNWLCGRSKLCRLDPQKQHRVWLLSKPPSELVEQHIWTSAASLQPARHAYEPASFCLYSKTFCILHSNELINPLHLVQEQNCRRITFFMLTCGVKDGFAASIGKVLQLWSPFCKEQSCWCFGLTETRTSRSKSGPELTHILIHEENQTVLLYRKPNNITSERNAYFQDKLK